MRMIRASVYILISCLLVLFSYNSLVAASNSTWHMVHINLNGNVGDAHIIINDDVVTMIDAGEYDLAKATLLPYLDKIGIKSIDHFFVSHPHNDHYKGIDALLENGINIKNVYYNMPPEGVSDFAYIPSEFLATLENAEAKGAKLKNVRKGFRITCPDSSEFEVLYAHKDRQLEGENLSVNDYSLIIRWNTEELRVLFTGDLNYLLGNYLSKFAYFKADVLKVPHHGVSGIAPDEFFDTVDPKINMFPTPKNLWSHPRIEQAKKWTLDKNILFCVAGLNGNIKLSFQKSTISLQPEKSTMDCPTGLVNINPGTKINESTINPQILMLLKSN